MPDTLRILVIDDDPVMRELLEALLGFAGHVVETVDSGESALVHLEAGSALDVVLTDLHMPGLQGKELAGRLIDMRAPGTLLVGMSGSYPSEEETHLLDYFLQKPFTPEQFDEALVVARARHAAGDAAGPTPESTSDVGTGVLQEEVFSRLAASLPAAALGELYALTLSDIDARLAIMQASLAAGDAKTVRAEAHAIKGACGMVGAAELYTLAAETEGAADMGRMRLGEFRPACERLRRMLDARLGSRAS